MAVYLGNKTVSFNNIINNSTIVPESLTVTQNGTYTADTGKAFNPVNVQVNGGTTLTPVAIRPDAELIKKYSNSSFLAYSSSNPLPAYNTSAAVTLRAATSLTPTIQLSYQDYNYFIVERVLTIPDYSSFTPAKGWEEYQFTTILYELVYIPGNMFASLHTDAMGIASSIVFPSQAIIRELYWSSNTTLAAYTSTNYGVAQVVQTPSATLSGVLTLKAPSVTARGHASYLAESCYNAIAGINTQYIIEVYRAPKRHLNVDGWGSSYECFRILECIHGTPYHTLS